MRRILVGVDGSKESRAAALFAAELAQATGARLMLGCAVFAHDALTDPEFAARTAHWEQEDQERGDALVKEIAAAVARPGVQIETHVVGGPAAATLARMAEGRHADVVVIGRRRRGPLAGLLTGRVADRLMRICPRPVLVVR